MVAPIGPTAGIVEVVATEPVVGVTGAVVEGETPAVVEVVFVNRVVVVTTVVTVVGTVVVVVTVVTVEVVVVGFGSTVNAAVAQGCDPCRQATIW